MGLPQRLRPFEDEPGAAPPERDPRRAAGRPCAACGSPARHLHHVVYEQHGGGRANANLLPICPACHASHHARTRVIPTTVLPDATLEHVRAKLGPYGEDYLYRYYDVGGDPRLEEL